MAAFVDPVNAMSFRLLLLACAIASNVHAQVPPSASEKSAYGGLFAAANTGDVAAIVKLIGGGAAVDARDGHGRTPLHVAAYAGRHDAMRALVKAGANPNALENDRYES